MVQRVQTHRLQLFPQPFLSRHPGRVHKATLLSWDPLVRLFQLVSRETFDHPQKGVRLYPKQEKRRRADMFLYFLCYGWVLLDQFAKEPDSELLPKRNNALYDWCTQCFVLKPSENWAFVAPIRYPKASKSHSNDPFTTCFPPYVSICQFMLGICIKIISARSIASKLTYPIWLSKRRDQ